MRVWSRLLGVRVQSRGDCVTKHALEWALIWECLFFVVVFWKRRRGFRGIIPWHGNWDNGESVPFQTGGVFFVTFSQIVSALTGSFGKRWARED